MCIIGAGMSGLRCASVLLGPSYDVKINEARNRIGNRVRDGWSVSQIFSIDTLTDSTKRSHRTTGGGHVSRRLVMPPPS